MNRLQEANAVGDYNIDWFNDLFTPLLIPILGIQAAHEVAHFIISKKDNVSISFSNKIFGSNFNILFVNKWPFAK